MGEVGLAENKANSAPIELELELELSLAKISSFRGYLSPAQIYYGWGWAKTDKN